MGRLDAALVQKARDGETCVSFEFFPPKAAEGVDTLLQRIAEMGEHLKPTFVSLTWRSAFKDEALWLRIGSMVQKQLGIDVLLHLTCHLPREDLRRVLRSARAAGIHNILALRGDSAHFTAGQQGGGDGRWRACNDGFKNATELVQLIREEHGDHFCVGVAGYPEVHTSCWNSKFLPPSDQAREADLARLKQKVDAGADFIITQFFYDVDVFWSFQRRCREAGITIPIIPGYAPIQTYQSFERFVQWVRPQVPRRVEARLAQIKDDDEAVREYGVEVAVEQCRALLQGGVQAIHFFTLNLAGSVAQVLHRLKLRDSSVHQRDLPFRGLVRDREEIRPIFWAHRHSSYLSRTSTWEEFPNGRWGNSRSAATFELADYYLAEKERSRVDLLAIWGVPQSAADVANVFVAYMRGEIEQLPWCDQALALETEAISESLCWINRHGFLTINSQPKVNGVPSTDRRHGWGGAGGVCFQKAYVEFFCSPEIWHQLRACMERDEFRSRLSYHATNCAGEEFLDTDHEGAGAHSQSAHSDAERSGVRVRKASFADELAEQKFKACGKLHRVNAVTWGVFPGREIIQPTVVDTESFRVWKDEAFELWLSQWATVYTGDETSDDEVSEATPAADQGAGSGGSGSNSDSPEYKNAVKLIREIHDTWFLVNIVDNDYVSESSDIFDIFKQVILDGMDAGQLRRRVDTLERENASLHRRLLRAEAKLERQERQLAKHRTDNLREHSPGRSSPPQSPILMPAKFRLSEEKEIL